jgi:hypothetical protein
LGLRFCCCYLILEGHDYSHNGNSALADADTQAHTDRHRHRRTDRHRETLHRNEDIDAQIDTERQDHCQKDKIVVKTDSCQDSSRTLTRFGFRVSGFGFRVSGFGGCPKPVDVALLRMIEGLGFRV